MNSHVRRPRIGALAGRLESREDTCAHFSERGLDPLCRATGIRMLQHWRRRGRENVLDEISRLFAHLGSRVHAELEDGRESLAYALRFQLGPVEREKHRLI
jgi:hypothetical protein